MRSFAWTIGANPLVLNFVVRGSSRMLTWGARRCAASEFFANARFIRSKLASL